MAIVAEWMIEGTHIFINDEYFARTPEEMQAVLDNAARVSTQIELRRLAEAGPAAARGETVTG